MRNRANLWITFSLSVGLLVRLIRVHAFGYVPHRTILWLRVYLPGATVLDGSYVVPPMVRVK